MTDSRFLGVAVGGSFAIHAIGYALVVCLLAVKGAIPPAPATDRSAPDRARPREERTLLTPDMILVEKVAAVRSESDRGRRAFVDASAMRATGEPVSGAPFEGDRNTRAGSEADPSVDPDASPDLPFQDGRDIPSVHVVESSAATGSARDPAGRLLSADGDQRVPETRAGGPHQGAGADESVRNAMKGAAPKRLEVAVSAVETPRARYESAVVQALKSSKNAVVANASLPYGDATVRFYISRNGSTEDLRFAGQPTDATVGDMALTTVLGATLPEIPPEVLEDLADGRLPFSYEFISY